MPYYWIVTTPSCTKDGTFVLANPAKLVLNASLTKALTTCADGEITISATGGTPPYFFYLNSAPPAPFLTTNVIPVTSPVLILLQYTILITVLKQHKLT
ncbi:SprB repeat-containing protein [Flavobacterium davisii]|uniref:SprB repeat-containing protein n=1 Tax=Flavobacterium columnare TaxID=996 RepID=A0A8G0P3N3_9FLAO|nr:SprB repeat-containing protein [Flavobacterium davisii]QYS87945.1 SprB repeat-containing protein [Flavobacterium davisii]